MTLPDEIKVSDFLCNPNRTYVIPVYIVEEIVKRYNNYPKLEEIKTLLENIIIELEQENKELKERLIRQLDLKNSAVELRDFHEQQYNKLRDAIKNLKEMIIVADSGNLDVLIILDELQSILDSVENEK